ncbi:hypothetical protein [Verrucosispora sp. NA02020]|uniref:hypothetical protein n=1 Tax=Verrucosispora sp. NA02020 TaxID=2742132 RepID=UPI0015906406|nr:hypothetical protein [Verrucosispora sp. NA02020]QKW15404.1 hypothetical protein HUT12_23305 [Verrucosispora sp. NA02020]
MTEPIPPAIANLTHALAQAGDDEAAQFNALTEALKAVPDLQRNLAAQRATVVQNAKQGRTWEAVGELFGIHYARASQIARGVSGGTKQRTTG